jgi:nucleoid-associated protein YgaU
VFLNDPWLWPEIWHLNQQVKNPHLIYPEDKLTLVMVDGQRKITVSDRPNGGDMVKLSPNVRMEPIDTSIPAIPLEKINAFLTKSRVTTKEAIEKGPYVIAGDAKRLLTGPGDQLFARGDFSENKTVFGVFRPGKAFMDPFTKEFLGVDAKEVGEGRVIAVDADVATVLINRVHEEIRIGDRLLPSLEQKVTARFIPHAPDPDVEGVVISVEGGVKQFGPWDIVGINLGERENIEVGHIFAISELGEVVKDPVTGEIIQLPDARGGLLMVFRTFEKMSFGLVLSAERALHVRDKVHAP